MRRTCFEGAKSIAGVGLVAAGAFILYGHLDRAAVLWGNAFGTAGRALGVMPAVIFAASRVARACGAGQQRFLQDFVEQVVMASWPLVLEWRERCCRGMAEGMNARPC